MSLLVAEMFHRKKPNDRFFFDWKRLKQSQTKKKKKSFREKSNNENVLESRGFMCSFSDLYMNRDNVGMDMKHK